ncbi:MAG: kinase-like domain-containing protein [Monoraphidium minutum]|nr:MAG: kinase-like domain-containing protein [Monoraphidium minutum]
MASRVVLPGPHGAAMRRAGRSMCSAWGGACVRHARARACARHGARAGVDSRRRPPTPRRARRLADGKLVVVKEIKTTALTAKQKAATMDEVEVLAKLDHPNIVHYHDCFMDEVYINIVMEYCDGGDLTGLIRRRRGERLPEDEVMAKFVQVVLALQYTHAQGVLHRDLKPSNVLVTSSGLLKLGDFGVSKISSTDASMASTIVGTPHYLSPEMCDNKPYGRKSDVWALGCILVELTTLQKAFDSSSISKIILSIMGGRHTPVPEDYSPELRGLAAALLQVDPAARPAAHEILQMPYVRCGR